ncbi:Uncharacterised protein g10963 [Pycnogonum litorale]
MQLQGCRLQLQVLPT